MNGVREQITQWGRTDTLTDLDVLSLIVGQPVADGLCERYGNLHALARLNQAELERIPGLGVARAQTLLATFELARRLEQPEAETPPILSSPESVASYMIPRLRDLVKEVFLVLLLTSANRLIREVEISEGILNGSAIHPREDFKAAIDGMAASVILVHNHPSGKLEPSPEDAAVTRQIVEAGHIVGIPVHDHIIIGGGRFYSFQEEGLMPTPQLAI